MAPKAPFLVAYNAVFLVELSGLLSNPQVNPREFSQDPEPVEHPFLDLVATISNPSFITRVEKLSKRIKKTKRSGKQLPEPEPKPRQGEVLKTIKLVLLEHPDGLQTYEVRQLIEERLGRKMPKSTVRDALANNRTFKRIGHGRYRLL